VPGGPLLGASVAGAGTVVAGRCTTITCWVGGGAAAPIGCEAGVADGVEPAPPAMIPARPSEVAALSTPATMRVRDAAWRRRRGRPLTDAGDGALRR
jgi:hypothetical protein